jgi:hypothetical protein
MAYPHHNKLSASRSLFLIATAATFVGGCDLAQGPEEPDADPDRDGIPNADDVCPFAAETFNNVFDSDGCPDTSFNLYASVREDVEQFWTEVIEDGGGFYQPLWEMRGYRVPLESPCGELVLGNASYCPASRAVYFDVNLLDSYLAYIGDMAPAFIIAHEIGHHIGLQLGYWYPVASGKQLELQADCYAAAWAADAGRRDLLDTGDVEEAVAVLMAEGDSAGTWFDPNEHGTPEQRADAFTVGFDQGVDGCMSENFRRTLPSAALSFDGVQQYVEVPDHEDLDLGASFTIEAWVMPTNVQSAVTQHVISKWGDAGDASYAVLLKSGQLGVVIEGAGGATHEGWSQGTLSDGVWQHVAVTVENGSMKLYINGALDTSYTGVPTPLEPTRPLSFGRQGEPSAGGYYAGLLDEIRIWNTARSEADLAAAIDSLVPEDAAGLVAYWRLNEGAGDVLYDITVPTGQGHNGRLGSTYGEDINDPVWTLGAPLPAPVAGGNSRTSR